MTTTYSALEFQKHMTRAIADLGHAAAYSPDNRTVNELEDVQERLQHIAGRALLPTIKARFVTVADAFQWVEQYQQFYNINVVLEDGCTSDGEEIKYIVLTGTRPEGVAND